MKKTLSIALSILLIATLAFAMIGCGNGDNGGDTHRLVGSWDWTVAGITTEGYWVFNADGTAVMGAGTEVELNYSAWTTNNGVLYLTLAGTPLSVPTWYYEFVNNNTLRLTSTTIDGFEFEYTRN